MSPSRPTIYEAFRGSRFEITITTQQQPTPLRKKWPFPKQMDFWQFRRKFSSVDNLLVAISIVLHEFLNQIIIKN